MSTTAIAERLSFAHRRTSSIWSSSETGIRMVIGTVSLLGMKGMYTSFVYPVNHPWLLVVGQFGHKDFWRDWG